MKKLLAVTLIVLLSIAAFNTLDNAWSPDFYVDFDGDHVDGPLGWLLGVLFAGGGLLIGAVAIVGVALFVGLLFAGLGMLLVLALAALAVALAAALSPLLLPLAIVIGLVWFFNRRSRQRRAAAMKQAAV
jgi:type IV secretory pathway VirB6-like protein